MPLSFLFNWGTFRNPQSKILHLLQLITASLEVEGLTGAENKPVELFKEKYEKNSRDF